MPIFRFANQYTLRIEHGRRQGSDVANFFNPGVPHFISLFQIICIYGPTEANRLFSHLSSSWTEVIFSLILLVSRKNKMKRRLLCKRTTRENSCFVIVYLCWRIEAHHFLQHAASRITSTLERVENTLRYEKATILVWGRA